MNMFNLFLAASKAQNGLDIKFEPEKFIEMLGYMGKGMLVIFVIIGVIILATALINKIFSNK